MKSSSFIAANSPPLARATGWSRVSPLYRHWEYLNFNEFRHEFEAGAE